MLRITDLLLFQSLLSKQSVAIPPLPELCTIAHSIPLTYRVATYGKDSSTMIDDDNKLPI